MQLTLALPVLEGRLGEPGLLLSRPDAASTLQGLPSDKLPERIAALYAVCAVAQESAMRLALMAAHGERPYLSDVDTLRVRLEAALESLWRIVIDWPALAGIDGQSVLRALGGMRAPLTRLLRDGGAVTPENWDSLRSFVSESILGCEPSVWLESMSDAAGWQRWLAQGNTVTSRSLSGLAQRDFGSISPSSTVSREAAGGAAYCTTGPWSRCCQHPLPLSLAGAFGLGPLAFFAAQLVDLCRLSDPGQDPLAYGSEETAKTPGAGSAFIDTARGLLRHEVRLEGDRLVDVNIEAPTDRLFTSNAPWLAALRGVPVKNENDAGQVGKAWLLALNPCVPYRVEVGHA